jgi:ApbE superfamily uncharacterized protein (UPF0280 family)
MIHELGQDKIYFEHGPVQMTVEAKRNGQPMMAEMVKAAEKIPAVLESLVGVLALAKLPWPRTAAARRMPPVLQRMLESVSKTQDETLTPMAAVAGTFADILADNLVGKGATKVIVNNGGDIALRLKANETTRVGISSKSGGLRPSHYLSLNAKSGIGGVTTSGLGGRSLTLGVADAVVVLGQNASIADACSTLLANSTDVACSQVHREPALRVFPDTDIPEMWVTTHVDNLPDWAVREALSRGLEKTKELVRKKIIFGAIIFVAGEMNYWPQNLNLMPI